MIAEVITISLLLIWLVNGLVCCIKVSVIVSIVNHIERSYNPEMNQELKKAFYLKC